MRLSKDELQDIQENAGRVTYRGVLDLLAALREAYGEIERLTGLIELAIRHIWWNPPTVNDMMNPTYVVETTVGGG